MQIQRLYCVLHALRRHQGTISDAEGWDQLNVCMVFYMHLGGHKRLCRFVQAYVTIWDHFDVVQDYWNATFVLIFTNICNDLGSFDVIQDYCNTAFVFIFTSICNDLGL